ncbi:hypothetical protein EVAR_19153_1 [Eumeta japonica]|uniref:Uncharacterized protein n=1 Tax=Eumeta variegata TaxID=151549 RepID=A0A4C1VLU8_EUMVA|nr:hypothetical protein EVAR_19153_1 [Eumeta japonica]
MYVNADSRSPARGPVAFRCTREAFPRAFRNAPHAIRVFAAVGISESVHGWHNFHRTRYPIPIQEASNALMTTLGSRVSVA